MSTHGLGDGVAPPTPAHAVAAAQPHDDKHAASPPFLHSPPDSNNAPKSAGSDDDSELSDLDEEPVLPDADAPVDATPNLQAPPPAADDTETKPAAAPPADDEDIGEVLPDHWSGNVAVFRPTMHQFKDFNKFVRRPGPQPRCNF